MAKSTSFRLTEDPARWHLELRGNNTTHQAMLKGGRGFSSGKRRLTNQGARLLTCNYKRTGDGCHKDQGDEGCLLKGHRTWGQYGRHTLATDIFKQIFEHIINPTPYHRMCMCWGQGHHTGNTVRQHSLYASRSQTLQVTPMREHRCSGNEHTSLCPFSPTPTPASSSINTSDSNPGKCIAFLYLVLGKKDVCT